MNQCAPDSSKRRPWSSEFDINGSSVFRDVDFESLQEKGAFVPESVIHALPTYLHCTHQLVGRRGGKAFLRRRIWHDEELSPDQIPSVGPYPSLIVLNYAMYPPSIVRLAPVMKSGLIGCKIRDKTR